jgi:hypothetical protein
MNAYGLQPGTVELASAGPITFGPAGTLFVADNTAATVYAVDVADSGAGAAQPFDVEDVDDRLASYLGCTSADLTIVDLDVHPDSHAVYLSVRRGHGDSAQAVLMRIGPDGAVSDVDLALVDMAKSALTDAPSREDERQDTTLPLGDEGEAYEFNGRTIRLLRQPLWTATVTDMAYVDGALLVAGLSNEEFSSKLRRIAFPFQPAETDQGNQLEIFHVSHGKWETAAPIRTFVPYDGGHSIIASYTCTRVVQFTLAGTANGAKVVGRTVAELGAANQPLDMVAFTHEGDEGVLVANSAHGLVKIARRDIERQEPLTQPKEPVGVPRETKDLEGIAKLANLGEDLILALQIDGSGGRHLRTLKTASL